MSINFKNIPQNLRLPLFYAEVDNSQANTAQENFRTLVIGQITSAGNAVVGVPIISSGVADAVALGGPGSMLALELQAYRKGDSFGEVWLLPLADAAGSVAASGSISFSAQASANGVLSLYIAGTTDNPAISVVITSLMTTAQIATAVVAAVTANTNLPVTAAVDGTSAFKVNFTAKNAGLCGNDIDIRVNYYGAASGEATPAGMAFTITQMSGGATNPVLSTALATVTSKSYDFIVNPYTDGGNLTAMQYFLNDVTGTWSWQQQLYGHSFSSFKGNFAAAVTFCNAMNDQHETVMPVYDSPTPSWLIAADLCATCAVSLRADPATPVQTLTLSTTLAPPLASRWPNTERNTLLFDGASTYTVHDDGLIALENVTTTYQKNGFSQPDNSYLEIETMFTLVAIIRQLMAVVTSRYGRVKLAADGTRFAAGSNVVTPSIIRGDIIAEYNSMTYGALTQDNDYFAEHVIVQQNTQNPNRVDVLFPAVLIDQLRIFATLLQFRLIAPPTNQ
jgi:phage tail sheath gpL-like